MEEGVAVGRQGFFLERVSAVNDIAERPASRRHSRLPAWLLALRPQRQFGRALYGGAPTFAALLELAGQRAMLLHLDVKEPGLEDDIARQFDDADAWDHVVSINTYNTARLRTHPKLKLLAYKGPGLSEARRDMEPDAVQAQLPSTTIILPYQRQL